jgi:hypothetical protein
MYDNYTYGRVSAVPGAENRQLNFGNQAFGGKVCRRLLQHGRGVAES